MHIGGIKAQVIEIKQGIIRHAGEIQHHLVHLCLTVAPDAQYAVPQRIEHGYDLLGSIVLWQVVPGSMIKYVAQKYESLCAALLIGLKQLLTIIRRSVYVGCKQISLHQSPRMFLISQRIMNGQYHLIVKK